ncbi:flagellar hook-basal body protein [Paenibacillus chartarius]|uniref:Flagellar hook-basal body protein n=1 Tax=Paenibacillus chartarius TaxID=747481 RepID=A0ABV6DJY4_9BACL
MNNSMINSSVSMHTLQQKLDLLASNIANVNTTGYKKKEASFEDVLTNVKQQPELFRKDGRLSPLGYNLGWGSKLVNIQANFAQGPISPTQNATDLAIQGEGMFQVQVQTQDANGNPATETAYTRNGAFNLSPAADGNGVFLATKEGHLLLGTNGQPLRIPEGFHPQIDGKGIITAYKDGSAGQQTQPVGQINLVRVVRPQLLDEMGDGLYKLQNNPDLVAANVLEVVTNRDDVQVRQGYLEQSNVNLSDEMTELVTVQRAFQLNARALTSADTMMNLANNLRG